MKMKFSFLYATNLGILFADIQWSWGALSVQNAVWQWHNKTVLLAAEMLTVINQNEPTNKILKFNIFLCYVTDPPKIFLKGSRVLCDRIFPIFLLNILPCYVIDSPYLPIIPFPIYFEIHRICLLSLRPCLCWILQICLLKFCGRNRNSKCLPWRYIV